MLTIHKYPLELADLQAIELPHGAEILTVQVQHDVPVLWAKVDTTNHAARRLIHLVGTGNPLVDHAARYIATIQLHGGALVLHAFEA